MNNYDLNKITEEQIKKGLLIRIDLNRLKEVMKEFDKSNNEEVLNSYRILFLNGLVLEVLNNE